MKRIVVKRPLRHQTLAVEGSSDVNPHYAIFRAPAGSRRPGAPLERETLTAELDCLDNKRQNEKKLSRTLRLSVSRQTAASTS